MRVVLLSFFATAVFLLMPVENSAALAVPASCFEFYKPNIKSNIDPIKIRQKNASRLIRVEDGHNSFFPFLLGEYVRSYKLPLKKNEFSRVREKQKETPNRDQVVETARKHLDDHGVMFKVINSQMYKGKLAIAPGSYLTAMEIRTSVRRDAHPINLLADVFQRLLGISLAYDPSYMDRSNFNGAYSKKLKRIYVSHKFIEQLSVDSTFVHEAAHAYFEFLRESGKHDNIFNSILKFKSEAGETFSGYTEYMNLEELFAHTLSIRGWSSEIVNQLKNTGQLASEFYSEFRGRIQSAMGVNKNAIESLPENLNLLNSGKASVELSDDRKRLIVTTMAQRVAPAYFTFVDPQLVALYKRSPYEGRKDALKRTLDRFEKLQKLATNQLAILKQMESLVEGGISIENSTRIEDLSRNLWARALGEVSISIKAPPPVFTEKTTAQTVIVAQTSLFDSLLPTSGFSKYEVFQKTLDKVAADIPSVGPLIESVRNSQIELVIYRKSRSRNEIAKNGFLNSHQSGRSGGDLNPERRIVAEASYLGMTPEQYRHLDDSLKPKYMVARFKDEPNDEGLVYGDDLYFFPAEKFSDQLTFTLGDSLDKTPGIAGNRDQIGWQANTWDQIFVPWAYRELMIPEIWPRFKHDGKLGIPIQSPVDKLSAFFHKTGTNDLDSYFKSLSHNGSGYVEVQKFGPLELSGATGFQFNKELPRGNFLKNLLGKNIALYDGRSGKRTPWKPTELELKHLLEQNEALRQATGYTIQYLRDTARYEDRVRVKWTQGTSEVVGLGWMNRVFKDSGTDYLEISQTYRGDELIYVKIPIDDIIDFKNFANPVK
ncbi:MAG: hypothetical protein B7Y39_17680 [Bdellovibrio sp. 28-41-41]|nr:MAG: hypothetical protein B7Y39_17680 [Bdellovibrio sp. 28-41-41]